MTTPPLLPLPEINTGEDRRTARRTALQSGSMLGKFANWMKGGGRPLTRLDRIYRVVVGVYLVCLAVWVVIAAFFMLASFAAMATDPGRDVPVVGILMMPALLVALFPIVSTIGVVAYVFPSMIAYHRNHRNFIPLIIVNLALGWAILGWIAALAWAFSSDVTESRQTIRHVYDGQPPGRST